METKECRVCLSSENEKSLFSPCLCKGSQSYIHQECLLSMREINENFLYQCPTCKFRYKLSEPLFVKYMLKDEFQIFISLSLSFFLVFLVAGLLKLIFISKKPKISYIRLAMSLIVTIGCPLMFYYNEQPEDFVMPIFTVEACFLYLCYGIHQRTKKFILTNIKAKTKVQSI